MNHPKNHPKYNSLIESELDTNELTIDDIKQDIKNCDRMIKRSHYKSMLYKRKLLALKNESRDDETIIHKGLSLFNLSKKISKKI